MKTILVIDDEPDICSLVCGLLRDAGYKASSQRTAQNLNDWIAKHPPSLVLLDVWLGDAVNGMVALESIRQKWPYLPVMIMSGHGNLEMAIDAMKRGANDFIEKPFRTDCLLLKIERCLEHAQLKTENGHLKRRLNDDSLMGVSPQFRAVQETAQAVAQTESRVLIAGPVGVGKEQLAFDVHRLSRRSQGPFCVVGCAALENRISDLFEAGWFEKAQSGTLVLDEVTDLSLLAQKKLSRLLQDWSAQRLESGAPLDVRLLSTTRFNIGNAIAAGTFHEELYYRLGVVPIEIPPLSARPEDVPVFLNGFMERTALLMVRPMRFFDEQALMALYTYAWPGNVRELKNTVERLFLTEGDGPILLSHLPSEMRFSPLNAAEDTSAAPSLFSLPMRKAQDLFMRRYLSAQLARFQGSISKTAEFIGMDRSALHRKIKHLQNEEDGS